MGPRAERAGVGGPLAVGGQGVIIGIRAGFRPGSDPGWRFMGLKF